MWGRFWAKVLFLPQREFLALWKVFWREALGSFRWSSGYTPEDGRKLWWLTLVLFVLFGLLPLQVLRLTFSYFNAFFLGYTFLMFLILFLLVSNFPSLLFSEKDAVQLAHFPIHNVSVFAAKWVLLFSFTLPWALGYSLILSLYLIYQGWNFYSPGNYLLAVAFLSGGILISFFVDSCFFLAYLWLLDRWGGEKLNQVFDILQWVFTVLLFSLMLLSGEVFGLSGRGISRPYGQMYIILLFPSSWFAGLSSLFLWHWKSEAIWIVASILSIVSTLGLTLFLFFRYREVFFTRVVESLFTPAPKIRKAISFSPPPLFFRKPVDRAMFRLLVTYSLRDAHLRSTLLFFGLGGLFLMVFLFFLVALPYGTNPADATLYAVTRDMERFAYYLSIWFLFYLFTLLLLRLETNNHWKASWVFYIFGGNPSTVFSASIKSLLFLLIPLLLGFYIVYFLRLKFTVRMTYDLVLTFLCLMLCGELLILWKPAFPLSQSPERTQMPVEDFLIRILIPTGTYLLDILLFQVMGLSLHPLYQLFVFLTSSAVLILAIRLVYPFCEKRLYWMSQEVEV
ncbi:MAG: hypothetical protein V2G48_03905 [bacterium JZ-2024 1]